MPRYPEGTWDAIRQELWYTPSRRDLLLQALYKAGEPAKVLGWEDFKRETVACIHGMYGKDKVSKPGRYTPQALEENSGEWQRFHAELTDELKRRIDVETAEQARLEACKQEPGGGILADGSAQSVHLAQELLGLDEENAELAVGIVKFTGEVNPTYLKGRKTWHTTRDDLGGQGAKDSKHTGKKKITFFYDHCEEGCKPGFYLVGWGVHTGGTKYQLVAMVQPVDKRFQAMRQWVPKMTIYCGAEKK